MPDGHGGSRKDTLRRLVEGALGNALYAIFMALGVAVVALFATILRRFKEGSFLDSLLWFAGAFGFCFLIAVLILVILKKYLYTQKPLVPLTESERGQSDKRVGERRNQVIGRATYLLMGFSILLLTAVGIIKWREYIFQHTMSAELPRSFIMDAPPDPRSVTSCVIGVIAHVVNNGPDSMPFNWRLEAKIPSGNVFKTPALKWSILGVNTNVDYFSATNDLLSVLEGQPIKTGDQKTGKLLFLLVGVPKQQISFGTVFTVRFEDGQGHTVTATTAWNGPLEPVY